MIFNPSHPGEVLKDYLGDMTVKEAAKRLGVTRPNLSRILNGRAGISAVMSLRLAKAMPHISRVLAKDAAQLRSFEGSEKQAAQNQTVSGSAAKGACLSPDLTSSPRTASTSIVQPGCTNHAPLPKISSSGRWRGN